MQTVKLSDVPVQQRFEMYNKPFYAKNNL